MYKLILPGRALKEYLANRGKQVIPLGQVPAGSDQLIATPQSGAGIKREATLQGELFIEVVDDATGNVVESHVYNALTSNFRAAVASLIIAGAIGRPTQMKLGTGATASMTYAPSHYDTDVTLGTSNGGSSQAYSQGVTISDTAETSIALSKVMLWLKRTGSPTGQARIDFYNVTAGLPSGPALFGSQSAISIGTIPTAYDWSIFPMNNSVILTKNTQYALVLSSTGYTRNAGVDEINIGLDNGGSYAGGTVGGYSVAWVTFGGGAYDMIFRMVSNPVPTQTDIYGLVTGGQKNFTSASNPTSNSARLLTNYTVTEAIEYIGHIGMFNAAGTLHAIAAVGFNKTASQSVNVYWVITVT